MTATADLRERDGLVETIQSPPSWPKRVFLPGGGFR